MKIIEVKPSDKKYINEIIQMEEKTFGKNGGADIWVLMPLVEFGKVFAIIKEERVIGACEFMISEEKSEAFLYGFSIMEEFQGSGVGKKLLEHSEIYFKEKNIKYISLTVSPENEGGVKLYTKKNYKVKSLEENYYGDGHHRFIMIKEL